MMPKNLPIILFVLAAAVCPASGARQTTMLPGTVSNFELPNFDENTGVKEWELFGDRAKYVDENRVDIDGIRLDLFEGKTEAVLRATIKSPSARVNPTTKISESPDELSVSSADFDMTGKKWKWFGDPRFVEIFSDVDISVKGGKSPDTKLKSDYASLDYKGRANVFVLRGAVSVKNSEMDLSCGKIELDAAKSGGGIGKITASENVDMTRDGRRARAGRAEIFPQTGRANLAGNPQITDIASKAKLGGARMLLDRGAQKVEAYSDRTTRAKAEVFHAEKDGSENRIDIYADKIVMYRKDGKTMFDIDGDVKIAADDFNATCGKLRAAASDSDGGKAKLEHITGYDKIRFASEDGIATGALLEIFPEKSEIRLSGDARLDNPKRGTTLQADTVVFVRNANRGLALSEGKKSFVRVSLAESADVGAALGAASGGKSAKTKTRVKSRVLAFSKDGKATKFEFRRDVSIESADISANCQKLDVFAESDDAGATTAKKIAASDGVSIRQKSYSAQAENAVIYPRLKMKGAGGTEKKPHKFVELSTDPAKPDKRPTIVLPPFKNIGMKDSESAAKIASSKTVIKSDKQWLTSSDKDDRYYFQGNVKVSGTDTEASCGKIEVVMRAPKSGAQKEITQIAMTENVKLDQGLKEVRCGRADIYADEQMLVLEDSPVVINREDNSRLSGHRIVYNKGSQSVAVEGEAPPAPAQAPSGGFVRPTTPDEDDEAPLRPTIKLPVKRK